MTIGSAFNARRSDFLEISRTPLPSCRIAKLCRRGVTIVAEREPSNA
jgi:hypothetical protein